ncbi:hypothetical protein JQ557_13760 [Bradyrhizobium sp. U87765 SZCCT0131]|uniref:hypothetical protein n=1 Tax=unclassified Bradyrhizobium TaxID=2631580 RepID=UPI001BA9A35F|nr:MULTISPECIES: hypothetical protein [unclassified Bradyrhizobium]MBR1219065.1 hypothetical protein [Bradyrhizobium sp. U87765 SZCCT0131]MBR1261716.1 hypothetical protein [Bradyrhizobium sp. U87765 SZCCT0134]MBR1306431.1 hypothetical protein [Bradyrhizobium sp. U87765 SZCCT0110]MBR1317498.1 hypothetical protein [Bradyrhizobium sp. U87765 SZCCT0109]MBR1351200.1 hypothetical protein [Bradyrhizobium sp. U87765 SZCCT0048]
MTVARRLLPFALAWLAGAASAHAHGIAGNRFFPGTLTFDDPAVADEAVLPLASSIRHPGEGGDVTDNRIAWSFVRLLTPTVAFAVDSGAAARNWSVARRSGFDTTSLTLKSEVFRSDPHEMLISASLGWGIGRSGALGIGAGASDTLKPGLFFGKGFGDLPDQLGWLRPFGIAGGVVLEHPLSRTSPALGLDPATGMLGRTIVGNVDVLRWGFAVEFSTLYLTSRFTGGPPKEEPLNQWVPLVEFAFDSPRGQKTAATVNPGVSYVAVTWQAAVEAVIPMNTQAGRTVGARAQMLFFLDDLIPSLFGKPLLVGR